MKIQNLKDRFSMALGDYLKEKGFNLRKANFEYVKKINKINEIYRIGIHVMTEWFLITPEVFLGCPQINKIFNDALYRKKAVSGPTCGFGIDNKFEHKRGKYSVDDDRSLSDTAAMLRKDFDEVALPWFEEVNSIKSIDRFMNLRRSGKFQPLSVSNACKGLIAAKLVNNPAFEEIFNDYYSFCVNAQNIKLAEPIMVLKKYLDEM